MIVSHEHKFIYLANGKTGTTSFQNQFKKYNECKIEKHATLSMLDIDYSDYFTFCFVRNPWDRIVSVYLQCSKEGGRKSPYREYTRELSRSHSFNDFLKIVKDDDDDFWEFQSQSRYYLDKGKLIDFVGRFENLYSDLKKVCDKLNIECVDLPHLNKKQNKHYTEYYNDETRELVAKKYSKDIEYFGYEFGK